MLRPSCWTPDVLPLPLAAALACAALWASSSYQSAFAQSPAAASVAAIQEINASITVNGQAVGRWTLIERNGVLYASSQAYEAWQIRRRVGTEGIPHAGQTWFPLASVTGFEAAQNFANDSIRLQFAQQAVMGPPRLATPTAPAAPSTSAVTKAAASPPVTTNSIASRADSVTGTAAKRPENETPQSATPAPVGAPAGALRILPLEVRINGAPGGNWPLLESGGMLYAPEEAFEEWRLNRREGAQPIVHRSQAWYALGAVPGYESRLNFANQSVDLVFSPAAFAATRLASDALQTPPLSPSIPAFFFNYDLSYSQSHFRAGNVNTRDLGALTEAGLSGSWGVLTSSFVGRNLVSSMPALKPSWNRLETSFTRDFPESKITLRLGDANTRAGIGSRNVYFGGLQVSRNFALQPGFVTQPIPVIAGTSSAPSTVELYVNDALRQTSNVPTGPFAIDNFPLLTGGGQVRMVVRDVLGRETVIVQPFFSHSSLLEKGLSDWSFEVGAVRENLGTKNADYGQRFSSGLYRYGFSKEATGEVSAQIGKDTQTLGLGLNMALPGQILGYASLAASRDDTAGNGHEWSLGAEYNHLRHGFNGRVTAASRDYRQLGLTGTAMPNKSESALNYTYSAEQFGSLGLGLARITSYTTGDVNTVSANYSMRVFDRGNLSFFATRAFGAGVASPATSVGMSLSIPLEDRRNSSTSVTHRAGQTDAYTSVSQGLPGDTGTGWRALAGVRVDRAYAEAGIYHQTYSGLYSADISASNQQQTLRLGLQSAFVVAGGQFHATRRVDNSFAIVDVPGYSDIGVSINGRTLAQTDSQGRTFVSNLMPFQSNSIRLDASQLPISAEIDNIEQIAVPAARSAVQVTFPVRSGRAALIKIVLSDGLEAPAGSEIVVSGDSKEFFVARRGEAFLTGLQPKNSITLKHKASRCTFNVDLPEGNANEEILRLGPYRCEGVAR